MKPEELHRWSQQFAPVSAPQLEPLEFLEKEHAAVLSQRIVPDGLGCTRVRQHLPREEMNRRPVEPEVFPERSPVLAQQGFQMCSGSSLQQRSIPDGFVCTRAHQTLQREEVNQRPVAQKPPQQYWKFARSPNR